MLFAYVVVSFKVFFLSICILILYIEVCTHECRYLWKPEEGIGLPGARAGVIDGCWPSSVVAGNQNMVFCKNRSYS